MGCSHDKTKAEEEAGAAIEEETGTAGIAEGKAACGWDEESIVEGRESVLIYLGL